MSKGSKGLAAEDELADRLVAGPPAQMSAKQRAACGGPRWMPLRSRVRLRSERQRLGTTYVPSLCHCRRAEAGGTSARERHVRAEGPGLRGEAGGIKARAERCLQRGESALGGGWLGQAAP